MQCHETSLVNLPVLHIIYIMFRDSRNPGSNQKFLLLVVFLEGFHPYFRLVPVQNNFRLELSLFQVIYLIKRDFTPEVVSIQRCNSACFR